MENINITIGNKMTINTQNYSSIQPSVSLTVNDVSIRRVAEVKEAMNNILGIFMAEEICDLSDMSDTIKTKGLGSVVEKFENPAMIEKMKVSLQNSLDIIQCEL